MMERVQADAAMRSQAAAWLARLRSEERTTADELGFQAWLDEEVGHRQAFDLVNTAWEIAGGAQYEPSFKPRRQELKRRVPRIAATVAAVLVVGVAIGLAGWMLQSSSETYATAVGEQKRVMLADGSVVMLDTGTSVKVSMKPQRRSVELLHGRAHFEVAKDKARPFAVRFGDRSVVAVGTAFDIARDGERASVLLTHGKVLLEGAGGTRIMSPGERFSFDREKIAEDRPDLDTLTAWQSGRAMFENQTLQDAVAELNRYSRRPLVIADPAVGEMRISGRYTTGDVEGFAISVSTLLPISVQLQPDRVVLALRQEPAPAPTN